MISMIHIEYAVQDECCDCRTTLHGVYLKHLLATLLTGRCVRFSAKLVPVVLVTGEHYFRDIRQGALQFDCVMLWGLG